MPATQNDRKEEILAVALEEFSRNGISGCRLQHIADKTGVTKAMIHYYFDTKEKLFEAVFAEAYNKVMSGLMEILNSEDPLFDKISRFIQAAIDRFDEQAELVDFIVDELNRNPALTVELMRSSLQYDITVLDRQLEEAAANYEIAPVDSTQLVIQMLSLCMFPYAGRTFLREVTLVQDDDAYRESLSQRKGIVTDTVINWLSS